MVEQAGTAKTARTTAAQSHATVQASSRVDHGRHQSSTRRPSWAGPAPAVATAIAAAFVCSIGVVRLLQIVNHGGPVWQQVEAGGYVAGLVASHVAFCVLWIKRRLSPAAIIGLLGLQVVLAVVPFLRFPDWWIGIQGFLAAALVLALRPAISVPVAALIVVTVPSVIALADRSAQEIRFGLAATLLALASGYGLPRLARLLSDIAAACEALVRAARTHERQEVAEQLDHRLATSLAWIMSSAQSAANSLSTGSSAAAPPDLEDLLRECRSASAEVRSVAGQYLDNEPVEDPTTAEKLPAMPPRLASAIVAFSVGIFAVMSLPLIVRDHPLSTAGFGVVSLMLLMALQLGYFSNPRLRPGGRTGLLALLAQACLVYVPILMLGYAWADFAGFLGGSLLLTLPAVAAIPLVAVGAAVAASVTLGDFGLLMALSMAVSNVATALVVYGLTRLARLARELRTASQQAVSAASGEERVRLSRDVHDLLGLSLSAMTLKAELATRLAPDKSAAAAKELTEIADLARDGIAEVRTIPDGRTALELDDEISLARAALTAADIAVSIQPIPAGLPKDHAMLLATVVREGVTNALKHSSATTCSVAFSATETGIEFRLVNDGVAPSHHREDHHGRGIGNLRDRVECVGGTFRVGAGPDGTYVLSAELPAAVIQ